MVQHSSRIASHPTAHLHGTKHIISTTEIEQLWCNFNSVKQSVPLLIFWESVLPCVPVRPEDIVVTEFLSLAQLLTHYSDEIAIGYPMVGENTVVVFPVTFVTLIEVIAWRTTSN